jgi:hypothetical protein
VEGWKVGRVGPTLAAGITNIFTTLGSYVRSSHAVQCLQIATGVLAIIPVVTGVIGMPGIGDPIYPKLPADPLLDSNLRFFSGVWLCLGPAMYWLIPTIEKQTVLFRVIWGMIFLGGVGRLMSMIFLALPPAPFVGFTILEIVGAPIFVAWQGGYQTDRTITESPRRSFAISHIPRLRCPVPAP